MTLDDIRVRTWERLDESLGEDSQRYTSAMIDEIVYDGARLYVAKTGCQYSSVTITAEAHTLLYDLPCDCIQIERVNWHTTGGDYYPLDATHTRELDATINWWQRSTDVRSRAYFAFGLDKIGLWPVSPDGGEGYVVEYQKDVGEMTAEDIVGAVPVEDHECLVSYVVGRFLLIDQKVPLAAAEIAAYRACVLAAKNRRSSPDKMTGIGRG